MSRRSASRRQRHSGYPYYLDEGLDGKELRETLTHGGISVIDYERWLVKNTKVPDDDVLGAVTRHEVIAVAITTDANMEINSLDLLIDSKARVIVLTDGDGGIANFAAALICSYEACQREFLAKPGPLVIHVNGNGRISVVRGEKELRQRQQKHNTEKIKRVKRSGGPQN